MGFDVTARRGAAGGTRCGLMLWRSALRADCAAVLASQGRLRCRSQAALPRRCFMASRRQSGACGAGLPLALLALQAAQGLAVLLLARHGQSTGLSVSGLASSPPQKSPTPDTAHRAAPLVVLLDEYHGGAGKAVVGCATAATLCGAEHRRAHGRARSARFNI